jgi:hypothetical protein
MRSQLQSTSRHVPEPAADRLLLSRRLPKWRANEENV